MCVREVQHTYQPAVSRCVLQLVILTSPSITNPKEEEIVTIQIKVTWWSVLPYYQSTETEHKTISDHTCGVQLLYVIFLRACDPPILKATT